MRVVSIVLSALIGCAGFAARAEALSSLTADKCLAKQLTTIGKGAAAALACHAKAAAKGVTTSTTCLAQADEKVETVLDKLDVKLTCLVEGTGTTRASEAAAFASSADASVGHAAGTCDAAKTKLVGKYVAVVLGCYGRAAGTTGTVDPTCLSEAEAKLTSGVARAESAGDCSHTGQTGTLLNDARALAAAEACALDPGNPGCTAACGNGISDPGEACDASVAPALWNECGAEFACVTCNCACPTSMTFSPDAAAPESFTDRGWTGLGHHAPLVSGGDLTLALSCASTTRPCGDCTVSGPIANPDAGSGQLDSGRCSTNSARKCMADVECSFSTCLGGGNDGNPCGSALDCPSGTCPAPGTCEFYAGPPQPLSVGGVAACVLSRFAGPVAGTLTVVSGDISLDARVTHQIYGGIHYDHPCPRCSDAGPLNDGVAGGTCITGARAGLACDANGIVPDRPDFGRTSLDCPPIPNALFAEQTRDLTQSTGAVAKTLTADSPNCRATGSTNDKCLCDTCNNANADPCETNADCPPSGGNPGICGGRRCLGSANAGAPCTVGSECPGGVCSRPGEPTRPSACFDDTATANRDLECVDADGNGVGECTVGPLDQRCALASGHGQRFCATDADCGGGPGSCETIQRSCFPTGGGTFQTLGQNDGTDTLAATGMADPATRDQSHPTLVSLSCLPPTGAAVIDTSEGLPGPARRSVKANITVHP